MRLTELAGTLLRRTTLRQLQVFEAVARLSSFSRAAEELHLAQPTVSMQLRKLADTLGYPLVEHAGNQIRLSDVGREVYSSCVEIFNALSNLEMKIAALKGLKQGHLRLGVITSAKYVAPHLLGRFCEDYPGIDVSLEVTNREKLVERIKDYQDELYILGQPPARLDVEAYPLIPNPLVVMAARNHPLVGTPDIPLARLLEEPFIMREPGSGTRAAVLRLFDQAGLERPTVKMEFASNESIKHAIVAGLGISVLSLHSLVLEGTAGPIAVLDVQGFPIERHWYVVHPKGKRLSVAALAFLDFARLEAQTITQNLVRELPRLRGRQETGPAAGELIEARGA